MPTPPAADWQMSQEPKPRRRFRFSLRTLLLLVAICSVGFGWLGYKMRQASQQWEAVRAMQKSEFTVFYDYEFDTDGNHNYRTIPPTPAWLRKLFGDDFFANVAGVGLKDRPVTDADFAHLQELTHLKILELTNAEITNGRLTYLRGMSQLQALSLSKNSQITDDGVAIIQKLKQLKRLFLSETHVTDAGLTHLEPLSNLVWLDLGETQVTDAGLVHLQKMADLRNLFLTGTQVTDAGLVHVRKMGELRNLYLANTQVTDEGCRELQKVLPNLTIHR